jgi:hypothetical protein
MTDAPLNAPSGAASGAAAGAPPGTPSGSTGWDRCVLDPRTGRSWRVRALPGPTAPRYAGAPCLVADASDVVRRFWVAPERWLRASDAELLQLIDGPHPGRRAD